jgi:hypothetical protein
MPREGATQGRPGAGTAKRLFTEAYDADQLGQEPAVATSR